jgi:hypothetical protein
LHLTVAQCETDGKHQDRLSLWHKIGPNDSPWTQGGQMPEADQRRITHNQTAEMLKELQHTRLDLQDDLSETMA